MKFINFKVIRLAIVTVLATSASLLFANDNQNLPVEPAFSEPHCPSIDNSIFLVQQGVLCSTLQRILSLHQKVQNISPVPIPLTRVFVKKNYGLMWTFVSLAGLVHLCEGRGDSISERQQDIIWIHEFGHMVFDAMLKEDFEDHRKSVQLSQKESDLNWTSKSPFTENQETFPESFKFVLNYSELFADFVTAVLTEDLDATYASYKTNTGFEISRLLSFNNQLQNGTCESQQQHFYFSYSRPVIAGKYLTEIKTMNEKKMAVLSFYKFISKDIIGNWKTHHSVLDCKKANDQLIESLK